MLGQVAGQGAAGDHHPEDGTVGGPADDGGAAQQLRAIAQRLDGARLCALPATMPVASASADACE